MREGGKRSGLRASPSAQQGCGGRARAAPVPKQGAETGTGDGMLLLDLLVVSLLLPAATKQATKKDFVEIGKTQSKCQH